MRWQNPSCVTSTQWNEQMEYRVGQGLDVHAFGEGDHVMLGAVRVPHHRGLQAHSDGDVALHALCDALLGALALGDIGQHFPPADEQLLAAVNGLVEQAGWRLANLDLTIACEEPKIAPHVAAMRSAMAAVLRVGIEAISVKATTTERLGFCGRGEGIAALAIVLISRD